MLSVKNSWRKKYYEDLIDIHSKSPLLPSPKLNSSIFTQLLFFSSFFFSKFFVFFFASFFYFSFITEIRVDTLHFSNAQWGRLHVLLGTSKTHLEHIESPPTGIRIISITYGSLLYLAVFISMMWCYHWTECFHIVIQCNTLYLNDIM